MGFTVYKPHLKADEGFSGQGDEAPKGVFIANSFAGRFYWTGTAAFEGFIRF